MSNSVSEAEISMVLDTFMYLDYKEAREGTSLNDILKDLENHPDYGGGGIHYGEYTVLKKAAANEEIGNLVICCQSAGMGYDSGTAASVFMTPDESRVYVVYRGTGDGEWPDNGIGMTRAATIQQKRALSYFEQVIEEMEIDEDQWLIVTGHSKGGNKAQFVTMETKYSALINACYSVDGQGFSENAIERWQRKYGEEEYKERTEKIYGIHGENDYVSVLGNSIIPEGHIRYVKTPVEKNNFAGFHDIKYMFASLYYDEEQKCYITIFNGRKNSDTEKRGQLGEYAALLSSGVMGLSQEKRDGCAAVAMQLMEASKGQRRGLNGERINLSDVKDFTFQGIPLIAEGLFLKKEGRSLLKSFKSREVQLGKLSGNVSLQVNYQHLLRQTEELEQITVRLKENAAQIAEIAESLPRYMEGGVVLGYRLRASSDEVKHLHDKLQRAVRLQDNIAKSYQGWDGIDFSDKI